MLPHQKLPAVDAWLMQMNIFSHEKSEEVTTSQVWFIRCGRLKE